MCTDKNSNAWLGIALIVFGAFFLLNNLNIIPHWFPHYLFGWEMILIVIGGAMAATGRREGFIFLAVGVVFIIPDIFYLPHIRFRDWWPVILIAIGVSIFIKKRREQSDEQPTGDSDFFEDTAIFGGSERSFSSKNFKGGKVTALFGGSEIDFRHAELHGKEVIIDQFCMFGGNTFRVPADWNIISDSNIIFGGFSDSRPSADRDPSKVLRIKGTVIFGGSEVK